MFKKVFFNLETSLVLNFLNQAGKLEVKDHFTRSQKEMYSE